MIAAIRIMFIMNRQSIIETCRCSIEFFAVTIPYDYHDGFASRSAGLHFRYIPDNLKLSSQIRGLHRRPIRILPLLCHGKADVLRSAVPDDGPIGLLGHLLDLRVVLPDGEGVIPAAVIDRHGLIDRCVEEVARRRGHFLQIVDLPVPSDRDIIKVQMAAPVGGGGHIGLAGAVRVLPEPEDRAGKCGVRV